VTTLLPGLPGGSPTRHYVEILSVVFQFEYFTLPPQWPPLPFLSERAVCLCLCWPDDEREDFIMLQGRGTRHGRPPGGGILAGIHIPQYMYCTV